MELLANFDLLPFVFFFLELLVLFAFELVKKVQPLAQNQTVPIPPSSILVWWHTLRRHYFTESQRILNDESQELDKVELRNFFMVSVLKYLILF